MNRPSPRAEASHRSGPGGHALVFGMGLMVGVTSCIASPIGLVVVARNALEVVSLAPVPWRDAASAVPFAFGLFAFAVIAGLVLGGSLLASAGRRLAFARRLQPLLILSGLSLLGWAATALVILAPFIDSSTSVTGLPRPEWMTIIAAGLAVAGILAMSGVGLIVGSARLADVVSDRLFGLNSGCCWECGHPVGSDVCPECGAATRRLRISRPD
jgi:hypothetical protein